MCGVILDTLMNSGPGRSRYGVEREAAMVTAETSRLWAWTRQVQVQCWEGSRDGHSRHKGACQSAGARQAQVQCWEGIRNGHSRNKGLAKLQGLVRSRYGVDREAVMVRADSKMSKFAQCKNLFLWKRKEKKVFKICFRTKLTQKMI